MLRRWDACKESLLFALQSISRKRHLTQLTYMPLKTSQTNRRSRQRLWQKLASEWCVFLTVTCNPWVIILTVLTIVFIVCSVALSSTQVRESAAAAPVSLTFLQVFLNVMISIFAGLAGAVFTSRWTKATETSVLTTRGRSAIRGLNLLLVNLASSETRTCKYLAEIKPNGDPDLVKHSYEEMIAQFTSLQEATKNAIEEWQDIIPEANITTQVGMISKLKAELVEKCSDVQRATKALADAQQASTEEKQELQHHLRNSQQELAMAREQLLNKENELSQCLGSLSGVMPDYSTYSPETGPCQCAACGTVYYPGACPVCGAC